MLGLRKISDRVVRKGSNAAQNVAETVTDAGKRSNQAAKSAYSYAMNHPKATAAVVLGTGVAAALLWMVQRSGGYSAVRRQVVKRVRGA
ncbi:MAG: hypothetical protein EPO20_24865 [Betaproteobacteria bacterium]|nr:MAG: hypothetical protein EPO20_24865 [Betaproteobacteria bacterium]